MRDQRVDQRASGANGSKIIRLRCIIAQYQFALGGRDFTYFAKRLNFRSFQLLEFLFCHGSLICLSSESHYALFLEGSGYPGLPAVAGKMRGRGNG